jgi:ketosteroid isomerase-like protein
MTKVHDDIEIIRELEDRRYQAMLDGDSLVLGELLADDLCYTHSNTARDTKETLLKKVADQVLRYTRIEHPEDRIIIAGDTAVVAGSMIAAVLVNGAPKQLDNSCLAVWTRASGRWQLLAYQPTPFPASR